MWAGPLLFVALAVAAPPDVRNRFLAEGIDKYDGSDYAGALQSLTQALDQTSSKRDNARIHLYIGLIQHRYKLKDDAEASFTKALDYDPKLRIPKSASKGAKAIFAKIRKAKFGEVDPGEARAEEPRKRKRIKHREGDGEEVAIEPVGTGTSASSAQTASASLRSGSGSGSGSGSDSDEPSSKRVFADDGDELPSVRARPRDDRESLEPPAGTVRAEPSGPPIAGWISVGVGVAAAVTGITMGVLAGKNGSDALTEPVASRAEALHATAIEQRTIAIVSFGVSGAALGLAAVLFLTD